MSLEKCMMNNLNLIIVIAEDGVAQMPDVTPEVHDEYIEIDCRYYLAGRCLNLDCHTRSAWWIIWIQMPLLLNSALPRCPMSLQKCMLNNLNLNIAIAEHDVSRMSDVTPEVHDQ